MKMIMPQRILLRLFCAHNYWAVFSMPQLCFSGIAEVMLKEKTGFNLKGMVITMISKNKITFEKFRELRKEELTMENVRNVFIQQIHKPARKVIIKREKKADEYFAYCEEVGCDVWG